jgi:hypothetical protein
MKADWPDITSPHMPYALEDVMLATIESNSLFRH